MREGRVLYTRGWGVLSATSRPCSVRDGDEASPDVGQARLLIREAEALLRRVRRLLPEAGSEAL